MTLAQTKDYEHGVNKYELEPNVTKIFQIV
jgi:hypothetical protein